MGTHVRYFLSKKRNSRNRNRIIFTTNSIIAFLDYGCGSGGLYKYFSDYFPNAKYMGIDFSSGMICEAHRQFPGRNVFHDTRSSEWKNRVYDLIYSSGFFHHIPHKNHETILEELSGRLAPGGKLVIWEHNPSNLFTRRFVASIPFDKDAVLIRSRDMKNHLLPPAT